MELALSRIPIRRLAAAALLAPLVASCALLPRSLRPPEATMEVRAAVRDQSGAPVKDAVVFASKTPGRPAPDRGHPTVSMTLVDFAFAPPVLPVRVGTGVAFLNRDDLDHQIYSISRAKNFDLFARRLSSSDAVVFDRPGPVVLGCAAHDQSIGHIYVLETPHFATTGADGTAELRGLPCGDYEVRVWHPAMKTAAAATARRVADTPSHRVGAEFTINVPPARTAE